jgi:hypothetical protein
MKVLGYSLRPEIVALLVIVLVFTSIHVWCSCAGGLKEGFHAGRDLTGAAVDYVMGKDIKNSWTHPLSSGSSIQSVNDLYKDLETHQGGQVPLKEGEMLVFAENEYKPECCPSTYSNSSGCVCASAEQKRYLNERGGNRTLISEF